MNKQFYAYLQSEIDTIKDSGMYKGERQISSPQGSEVHLKNGQTVINLCANNYLGLANHPILIEAAQKGAAEYGFGLASVRFICGTQTVHKELESKLSHFLQKEDTILYSSCFDANTGLFETILGAEDAIISDQLNHASVIDGIRLCKAKRFRYQNNDMADLETQLKAAVDARFKMIATDGVFSMDGIIANLPAICDLADKYNAIVMVDDSHAVGFIGKNGRGTPELCGVMDRVDIVTGTLGKALGGASGGYTSGRKEVIEILRQRSRPYLFSNTLAPMLVSASIKALDLMAAHPELRDQLQRNSQYFRTKMTAAGFDLIPGEHPIIPVMFYDEKIAKAMAEKLLVHDVYVTSFTYPVVPKGLARIRTQMSAAHTLEQLDYVVAAFISVAKEMEVECT